MSTPMDRTSERLRRTLQTAEVSRTSKASRPAIRFASQSQPHSNTFTAPDALYEEISRGLSVKFLRLFRIPSPVRARHTRYRRRRSEEHTSELQSPDHL